MVESSISEGEARFEAARRRAGLWLAPVAALGVWFLPLGGLSDVGHRLLAILAAVMVAWMTEVIPLAATALIGVASCVAAGVVPAREAFKGFGDPVIFIYLGGFFLAEAIMQHGLNRRVALSLLGVRALGSSPGRILAAYGVITAVISMWISNTATTAMMLPIGLSLLAEMGEGEPDLGRSRYAAALMLMTSFSASIGGLATPVGTPPNLIGLGQIERLVGIQIGFFQWMAFGFPLAALLIIWLVFWLGRKANRIDGAGVSMASLRAGPGPMTRAERNVALAFLVTVALWILPGVALLVLGPDSEAVKWLNARLPESVAAILGAGLLFLMPVDGREGKMTLEWRHASRIDWGTLLLFGGGLSLGEMMFNTGLAQWMGEGVAGSFPAHSEFGLIVLFTATAIVVSETTSNAASATMVVPVAIAVAQGAGVPPLGPALAACLGSSMGFMLPVSTPPNAIVYGSGRVGIRRMAAEGVMLDLAGFVAIVLVVGWWVPVVMKAKF